MTVLRWIGLGVLALLALRFLAALARAWLDQRRVDRRGVDGFADLDSYGFDAHLQRPDGKMACVLHLRWKHPQTGQEFSFDSPWFWTDPGAPIGTRFPRLPVRVVLADPARLHRVDMSGTGVELWAKR